MGDGAGDDIARLRHAHGERLKELSALHDIARLLRDTALSIQTLLARVADRLPASMQYPDDTSARVQFDDIEIATPGFAPGLATLRQHFETTDRRRGTIEIAYRSPHTEEQEGPFLAEERALIDSITDMVRGELDRRSADSALREREATLVLAAETADLSAWEWLVDEDRVLWSPELVRLIGSDFSGNALGVSAMIHPADKERVIQAVRDAPASPDGVLELEFRARRSDGRVLWIGARGRVLAASEGRPLRVVGVLADITRRKALEDDLRQLQKMEAMGRLAAGVAHDFNNLLAVISMNAHELLEDLRADDPCRELATEIHAAMTRGAALTQQLLAFSRRSELNPVKLDPDVVIRQAEPILRRLVGREIKLELALAATRGILMDATQLDQVVMNLVVNARDALDGRGTVTIGTRLVDVGRDDASKAKAGAYVVITVSDTGRGMTPEVRARLFDPFFTTKPPGKGTGLGLAVVFGVVQQSNGFVTVDSEPDRGAHFHVHFPASS